MKREQEIKYWTEIWTTEYLFYLLYIDGNQFLKTNLNIVNLNN